MSDDFTSIANAELSFVHYITQDFFKNIFIMKSCNSTPILNSYTLDIKRIFNCQYRKHNTTMTLWINQIRITALFRWQIFYFIFMSEQISTIIYYILNYHSHCAHEYLHFVTIHFNGIRLGYMYPVPTARSIRRLTAAIHWNPQKSIILACSKSTSTRHTDWLV